MNLSQYLYLQRLSARGLSVAFVVGKGEHSYEIIRKVRPLILHSSGGSLPAEQQTSRQSWSPQYLPALHSPDLSLLPDLSVYMGGVEKIIKFLLEKILTF